MIELILGPLLKIVGFDYKNKRAKDKELLTKFLEVLPPDSGAIEMLRNTDMGDPIFYDNFKPLNLVADAWSGPDKEFQVKKLEKRKLVFIKSLQLFLSEYAKHSALHCEGVVSIGIRDMEERSEMFEYRDKLNEMASKACANYDNFVREARREI
ncbi:MAG: hypothetical protein LRY75_04945 [Shewanella xiamenensis]|nr:hypothetical protein [Shewanella xiamenensis]